MIESSSMRNEMRIHAREDTREDGRKGRATDSSEVAQVELDPFLSWKTIIP